MTETVFLTIAAVGALLLIVSIVFGDFLEFLEAFDGLLSTTALGVAATLFGANGFFVLHNGGTANSAVFFATLWAVVGIAVAVVIEKLIIKHTAKVTHNLIGLHGVTITEIGPNLGKVQIDHYSEANSRFAFSDSLIPAQTEVVILEKVDGKVKVEAVPRKEENA